MNGKGTAPLDRKHVVRVSLELLNEVGLDKLTVRRVADRLNVQNPALYWHFKNKRDLLNSMAEAMLNEALGDLIRPAPTSDPNIAWKSFLKELAFRFWDALISHRDGARVCAGADLAESILQEKIKLAQDVLADAGCDPESALLNTVTLLDFTLGAAFEGQAEQPHDAGDQIALRHVGFRHGVNLILAGIAASQTGAG